MKNYLNQIIQSQKILYKNINIFVLFFIILLHIVLGFAIHISILDKSVIPILLIGIPYLFWYEVVRSFVYNKYL